MNQTLTEIEKIVKEASKIMLTAKRDASMVDTKEGHANFVTTYDKKVQQFLEEKLLTLLPEAVFVGEEDDKHGSISNGLAFIVDPIDGTTNFIKDYKCSCISVGLLKDGVQYIGVVYNPYADEMFSAVAGQGAWLNGQPIHVSNEPTENALVIFGTAPYYENLSEKSLQLAFEYCRKTLDIRRSGSAALDLCNIACGRAEIFFELRLQPWDFAAGSLIVKEAGGTVTQMDVKRSPLLFDQPISVIATNGIAR